jgi:hypothetical protein
LGRAGLERDIESSARALWRALPKASISACWFQPLDASPLRDSFLGYYHGAHGRERWVAPTLARLTDRPRMNLHLPAWRGVGIIPASIENLS